MHKTQITVVTHRNSGVVKVMADEKEYEVAGRIAPSMDCDGTTRIAFTDETLSRQEFTTRNFTALVI